MSDSHASQRSFSVLIIIFLISFSNCSSMMRIPSASSHTGHMSHYGTKLNSKRSLVQLADMIETAMPGKKALGFVGYGNWCGPGGGGEVVDAIDRCCQYHDNCYDRALHYNVCSKEEKGYVYTANYEWKTFNTGNVECGDNPPGCEAAICLCDTQLVNCLKKHIESFSEANKHSLNVQEFLNIIMDIKS